jgi:hypothetical protein
MNSDIASELQKLKKQMEEAAAEAAKEMAQQVLQKAQETVPVKSGALKLSAKAELVRSSEREAQAAVAYDAPYAPDVHENPNSTGYKWLENASTLVNFEAIVKQKWEESNE